MRAFADYQVEPRTLIRDQFCSKKKGHAIEEDAYPFHVVRFRRWRGEVIGDEPATPTTIRVHQRLLCRLAKTDHRPKASSRDASINGSTAVCFTIKPVGKPAAG